MTLRYVFASARPACVVGPHPVQNVIKLFPREDRLREGLVFWLQLMIEHLHWRAPVHRLAAMGARIKVLRLVLHAWGFRAGVIHGLRVGRQRLQVWRE